MKSFYSQEEALAYILNDESSGKVVMMCGISGSGKTTFAKQLEAFQFRRLSIDEEIWNSYGRYGIDYPEEKYQILQIHAEGKLFLRFQDFLKKGYNIVLDFSFWQKKKRDEFKNIIQYNGRKCFLIYMDTAVEVIKIRLARRNESFDANAAFPITGVLLNRFIKSFEIPSGEGELCVRTDDLVK